MVKFSDLELLYIFEIADLYVEKLGFSREDSTLEHIVNLFSRNQLIYLAKNGKIVYVMEYYVLSEQLLEYSLRESVFPLGVDPLLGEHVYIANVVSLLSQKETTKTTLQKIRGLKALFPQVTKFSANLRKYNDRYTERHVR